MGDQQWALVISELDNIILNNYWRKYYTYLELGWDDVSIKNYLSQKQYIMQIASFNTPYVSFSASSRRNRFYEVYNRENMLDQDVAWGDSIETLKKIDSMYKIYIISSRTDDMEAKTLEVMTKLGFPMDKLTIFFKKPNDKLFSFRRNCLDEIVKEYPSGAGIWLSPSDNLLYERYDHYTPIGFTSIKEIEDFQGQINVVCNDWAQIHSSLGCS